MGTEAHERLCPFQFHQYKNYKRYNKKINNLMVGCQPLLLLSSALYFFG